MSELILKAIYSILIFCYISMRIMRDGMIVAAVGQEGTSVSKAISLILIFIFSFFQNKYNKKASLNKGITIFCLIFGFLILIIHFDLIPNNEYKFGLSDILNRLLNKPKVLFFYILSEIFAVFIVTNFWLLSNSLIKKHNHGKYIYNQLFSISQIGVLISSGTCILFSGMPLILISFCMFLISYLVKLLPTIYLEEKKETQIVVNRSVLMIPFIGVLCGLFSGMIDPYTKVQIQKISFDNKTYINRLGTMWILQAVLSMIFGEIFKFQFVFKKVLTPAICTLLISILLFLNGSVTQFYYAICCSICVVVFKTLKYSTHSPFKENYIKEQKEMNSILFFDGLAGRFGKNYVAIIFAVLFNFGFKWVDIENTVLVSSVFCTSFWFILAFSLK
ncbi:MAG: hypothetical protein ACK5XN_26810 [Bacteroidota bacterium]